MKTIPLPHAPLTGAVFEKIAADRVIEGTPAAAYDIRYTAASGDFTAGIYECTAGKWRVSYSEDEFCTLLEGAVRLTNAQNETQEYAAPASFVIPSGFSGTWEAIRPVRKLFVIYEKTS